MDPLFELPPDDLADLDPEALAAARDTLRTRIADVAAGRRDPDVVGDRTQTQVSDEMSAAVEALERINDEIETREQAEAAYDTEVAELAAQAGVELSAETTDPADPDPEDPADPDPSEPDPDDPAAVADPSEPQAVTASTTAAVRRPLPAARKHKPTPTEIDSRGLRLTSHAQGLGAGLEAGTPLDRVQIGRVLNEMVKKRIKPGERAIVAAASYDYPSERILDERNGDQNMEKIQNVLGPLALVASGANCAPLTPIYDLPGVETADRPVRDSLPSFQATRGGVQVGATPKIGDYAAAVDVVTADDNEAGGTFALKNCTRIECPEFTSVQVDSIYHCTEADNLASRAYPELMSRIEELVRVEQARLADSKLLTEISAGSTQVSAGEVNPGAVASLVGGVYQAAAGMRSRNRISPGTALRAIFPEWVIDLLAVDFVRGQFDRVQTRQAIVNLLESAGIRATFSLDGSATASPGQVFGAQSDGALLGFPSAVEWFLFPEGTWLHLDSGVLELGVVRDSSLNLSNDFQIFGETWEQVAFVGVESLAITSVVCPSGETVAPVQSPYCGT